MMFMCEVIRVYHWVVVYHWHSLCRVTRNEIIINKTSALSNLNVMYRETFTQIWPSTFSDESDHSLFSAS